ncbi:hypothetical protein [Nocardiopsis lucentensis]|uniref:hypothetical protein n=1 Tax=Nocardiopsis lucentensis TaxID=53441 RepID=UPI000346EB74|nr:hypothetical protein [Nocardiopsis lucentensis]
MPSPLNSYDEWSPLREIVVGRGEHHPAHDPDISFRRFYHDELLDQEGGTDWSGASRRLPGRYVDELVEDLEELATTLRGLGVTVHRPDPLPEGAEFATPSWRATMLPALNVRDQTLVLGDEIIETPPQLRARYFEPELMKPVLGDYFRRGARWTVMPRPVLGGASPAAGEEMTFDAAQCVRLGRDVLVNVSTPGNALALEWLRRHLGDRFRLHRVDRLCDYHLDTTVLALRPGTLLVRDPGVAGRLPEALRRWQMIFPPEPEEGGFPEPPPGVPLLTSRYIDLNVLSVDPDTVIVNALWPKLMVCLESHGFTVVPVRHRHRRLFGGGFHCVTLDTVREGSEPLDHLA